MDGWTGRRTLPYFDFNEDSLSLMVENLGRWGALNGQVSWDVHRAAGDQACCETEVDPVWLQ